MEAVMEITQDVDEDHKDGNLRMCKWVIW